MQVIQSNVDIKAIRSEVFNRLVDDLDSIRRDNQRIASSLEELVKCLSENNNR